MSDIENLSFEQSFEELENLVQQLEAGDLTLDQAMALFGRGMALATHCNDRLDAAELQVRQLLPASGKEPSGEAYASDVSEERSSSDDF